MPLTLFSLLLIVVGIAGGTLLTQKQTRTASLAATGATCADNPWRPNGGTSPYDYSACGVRFGAQYAVGQCGYNTSVNKYFLCKRNPSNPIIPNDENWFGPCDRPEDCQAAQTAAGSPTTAPQGPQPTSPPAATQPTTVPQGTSCNVSQTTSGCTLNNLNTCQQNVSGQPANNKFYECRQVGGSSYFWFGPCDYNLCTTPPSPTPTPTPPVTTINTSVKFVFNLGLGLSTPSVFAPPPSIPTPDLSYFTVVLTTAATNTEIYKQTIALKNMNIHPVSPIHSVNDSINYYQYGEISNIFIKVPTTIMNNIAVLNIHVFSTESDGTSQNILFCNGTSTLIDKTISITDPQQIKNFLTPFSLVPLTINMGCSSDTITATVNATQYSRTQLEDTVKQYVNETIGTLEMSAYLSELSRIPRMGWKFCDPQSGGCTAKF